MNEAYSNLAETIKDICGSRPVYYLPNNGNWGDGLIRHGTKKFFHEINLKYKELRPRKRDWVLPYLKGGTVIFGGGGSWASVWKNKTYVEDLSKRFHVIVLPSTFDQHYEIPNTTFFARDKFESMKCMPESIFCHDMAFFIGDEFYNSHVGEGSGFFFREDKESSGKIEIPSSNVDISLQGSHLSDVTGFFKEIEKYENIYTDRLHVSIAGALLRKKVFLYPGSYFKSRAIYESSIAGVYQSFNFVENWDIPEQK